MNIVDEKIIKLIEVMSTWQGEGPDSGRQMLITRFKVCNIKCPYCDTAIKMRTCFEGSYSISDLNEYLQKTKALMITGGEPTFNNPHNKNFDQTSLMLHYCDYQVANVESNGCDLQRLIEECDDITDKDIKFIYSPKVFNEKQYETEIYNCRNIIAHSRVYLKIVVDGTPLNKKYISEVTKMTKDRSKIYLMPCGDNYEDLKKSIPVTIDYCDEYNCNYSPRLHIMNNFT